MSEICSTCGLPEDLCVCEAIAKEEQTITIKEVKRRFGKMMTVIEGIDARNINMKDLTKKLKSKLACGGTLKENSVELQGRQKEKAKKALIGLGFAESSIILK